MREKNLSCRRQVRVFRYLGTNLGRQAQTIKNSLAIKQGKPGSRKFRDNLYISAKRKTSCLGALLVEIRRKSVIVRRINHDSSPPPPTVNREDQTSSVHQSHYLSFVLRRLAHQIIILLLHFQAISPPAGQPQITISIPIILLAVIHKVCQFRENYGQP